ncbi:hypothetical protein [Tsukamurella pseudospumae]|uniref:Tail assembly chaperone n=1 Tax=Tsukamurella pseudospumae TaxID=239498 RepID=A0A137ZRU1_9ACTN|nr:hypothetical protein [Tsukamurella pseudospumae]KXP00907.1 hypothetical protein AXK61_12930 [Tsukamurella pseudospumae]
MAGQKRLTAPDPDGEYDEDLDDDSEVLEGEVLDDPDLDEDEDDDEADEVEVDEAFEFESTQYTPEQLAARKVRHFKLDGETLRAEQPDDAAYALLSQAVASAATNSDRTHAILNFAWGCLDDRSKMVIQHRLYDRTDGFGLETLAQIVDKLLVDFSPDPKSAVNRAARRNAAKAKQPRRPQPRRRR